jgi:PAT family beta-lactamase induction signal transducer AmpG
MSTRHKLIWVGLLYFAEGFPFGILVDTVPVYFRLHGVNLSQIGLLSVVSLAWTLKWMWAPAVDRLSHLRNWIVSCQALSAIGLLAVPLFDPASFSMFLWGLLVFLAVVSATQDIAIDAATIRLLTPEELGPGNGVRVMAYRVALIVAGGLLVALAGLASWTLAFVLAGVVMGVAALMCLYAPFGTENTPSSDGHDHATLPTNTAAESVYSMVLTPLKQLYAKPGFVAIALFILTYKLGDMALGPMVKPFWVDRHFTPVEIGLIPGTFGVVSTIGGALLGGWLTTRLGLFRALWSLGLCQAASNLAYVAAAASSPSIGLMYGASMIESFCGGLGTSPFLALLMSLCDKSHAATQYAVLSALFGLTRVLAGSVSGIGAQAFGYTTYFLLTCLLAFPAFLLLPWVKPWATKAAPPLAHASDP